MFIGLQVQCDHGYCANYKHKETRRRRPVSAQPLYICLIIVLSFENVSVPIYCTIGLA